MRRMFSKKQIEIMIAENPYVEIPLILNEEFTENSFGKLVIQNSLMLLIIAGSIPKQDIALTTLVLATGTIPSEYRNKLFNIPNGAGIIENTLTFCEFTGLYDGGYFVRSAQIQFNKTNGAITIFGDMPAGTKSDTRYISMRVPLLLV